MVNKILKELEERGKAEGKLSYNDVIDALENIDLGDFDLASAYDHLVKKGVELVEEDMDLDDDFSEDKDDKDDDETSDAEKDAKELSHS